MIQGIEQRSLLYLDSECDDQLYLGRLYGADLNRHPGQLAEKKSMSRVPEVRSRFFAVPEIDGVTSKQTKNFHINNAGLF